METKLIQNKNALSEYFFGIPKWNILYFWDVKYFYHVIVSRWLGFWGENNNKKKTIAFHFIAT